MAKIRGSRWVWGALLFCAATATISSAQDFTTLVSFNGTNGKYPSMTLVQGVDGNFYGTTAYGGNSCNNGNRLGCGAVFKISPAGTLTRLYSFCTLARCSDGEQPEASLVQGFNGKFYGTTSSGGFGPDGCGTVFAITAKGQLTTLHIFQGATDGCALVGGLVQAATGNFYGTTMTGGAHGGGTIFEITALGTLTTLYNFCSLPNCADGKSPGASLVQGTDGNFYGITASGGISSSSNCSTNQFPNGCGTIFKTTAAGKLTTLYSFCSLTNCADGSAPEAAMIQANNGDFYGTTYLGGTNCTNDYGCGTVFEITPTGNLTTLYSFCSLANCADGRLPVASLVQGSDGNFYGTTEVGGNSDNAGTLFEVTPGGLLTTLYSFCFVSNCADGAYPSGGILQATSGVFYGSTFDGGTSNDGTVFSLNTGLGPFVSFIRNPAKAGQQFGILGYGLTGTTSVSLNGIAATFKVQSDTLLVATVPTGATSGYVTVTTPSGTLTSNVPFQVL